MSVGKSFFFFKGDLAGTERKGEKTSKHSGVGKVQGAGAGWTGGKVRSPECDVQPDN